ncbi:catechol 1,2-dioxygenase [Shimwellia blattae]|uniref:catechol 1,2-dioxygenase n=1 Tax=Shimwellia blattae (strain ATCC 29907 / DSM 4481 / JCM 1650 / NBRC 105725 / CDC 9005-74) TaxID=630626 RepID=I2B8Q2_SHIBC|nr:catechol 1,2-dioxygenase [Shimwellia blattae]AFJ46906.1 catechol 1,2-dioxygenase [Shimwellia blattae DSM 4481 = NBRC 105725]GAB82433.1 catechol 1,2-dioxygenase [Shimwellia blattae DSM 4481 = NBRC 105725]VDY64393.1 Catechol 1,2-dioxygenase [Shimwellia blattae]VEC22508.1 Catechol 1,2-dioxygenase [Shimwellia blattae]
MSVNKNIASELNTLLTVSSGINDAGGNERFKKIMLKVMSDICDTIDQFDVTDEEFWQAINYINLLGERKETALLAAGLGIEHYLDLRADALDAEQGNARGTPRTIEGPLYVANAPLSPQFARMDDGTDNGEIMWLHGQVTDTDGNPVANAIVDVWHANTLGNYSFFDQSQSEYNLRRRIQTGADGRYAVRSIVPSGYGCPPDGPTQALLNQLGRHGNRPAHIHFFVSAPGYKHLTTQINLSGDKYLWDDFAFATRDGLVADPVKITDGQIASQRDINQPHTEVNFNFTLCQARDNQQELRSNRPRALQS